MGEFKDVPNLIDSSKEVDELAYLKEKVLENPDRFIDGAIGIIAKNKKEKNRYPGREDVFISEVLKFLFPTRENYWTDEKLVNEVKKRLVAKKIFENNSKSKASTEIDEETEEEGNIISPADGVDRWEKMQDK